MKTQILKPGFLVSLKTTIKGGVQYGREDIEADHTTPSGSRRAEWKTTRVIPLPEEYEAAQVIRNKARTLITGACCASSFGLLCPLENERDLYDAIDSARTSARDFNDRAAMSRVEVYVLTGRIAESSAEAERAIASELRELLDGMQAGIAAADVSAIREAANKARAVGAMLSGDVSGKVSAAIEQARKAAREIAKRVEKSGERAADVVRELNTQQIEAARFAFLDFDPPAPVTSEAPAAPGLDLTPEPAHDDIAPEARAQWETGANGQSPDGISGFSKAAAPFTPAFEF